MKLSDHQREALVKMRQRGLYRDRAGWRRYGFAELWRASSGTVYALERKGLSTITPNGTGGHATITEAGRKYLRSHR